MSFYKFLRSKALVAISATFIVFMLSSCREGLVNSGGSGLPEDKPGEVNDSAGFYVKVYQGENIKYYEHKVGSYTESCKIEESSASNTTTVGTNDIQCIVDIPEEDLSFHGVKFQVNVPSTMCSYVTIDSYLFENWKNPSSYGAVATPTSVTTYIGADGTVGASGNGAGVVPAYNRTIAGVKSISADGIPVCNYDYSEDYEGPNCCEGSYNLFSYKWNPDKEGGAGYDLTSTKAAWGGKISSCYAGPAMDTASKFTKKGFPYSDIIYVEGKGINKTHEPSSPMSREFGPIYLANYYDTLSDSVPAPPQGLKGAYVRDSYEWVCLDRAREPLARIQMYVKEWNSLNEFKNKGNSDTSGADGGPGGGSINDFPDWLDFNAVAAPTFEERDFRYPRGN